MALAPRHNNFDEHGTVFTLMYSAVSISTGGMAPYLSLVLLRAYTKDYGIDLHSNGRGLFGVLGLAMTRTADFLEFAFADFDTAEVGF